MRRCCWPPLSWLCFPRADPKLPIFVASSFCQTTLHVWENEQPPTQILASRSALVPCLPTFRFRRASWPLDDDPVNRFRVNESPQQASLGRGHHHESNQAHGGADHSQAQNRRAAVRLGQDRRRGLPSHRGDAADVPPLAAAVRWDAGRGSQPPATT
jgi:hypothetical protein